MAISVPPAARLYAIPAILLALGFFFQLVVLPSSFPTNHYDVLGVRRYASIEEVTAAYEKLSSKWFSGLETPTANDFIKIRYAFELLANTIWKRDYDIYGIDEQLHVVGKISKEYEGGHYSKIGLPLLNSIFPDSSTDPSNALTFEEFNTLIGKSKPLLILVYSVGSSRCAQFISNWKRIAGLLEGVSETGMVELGNVKLASYFAERKFTNQPFFRGGLPALVVFPYNCRSADCYVRYEGDLTVDAVVDWMASEIIGLPRIPYYTSSSLIPDFIVKRGQHKAKVIFFSESGERAAPFLRQAAKDYSAYASFGFILWRESDYSTWATAFNVESAPAIVILKDHGSKPFVYHGRLDKRHLEKIMDEYKQEELPELRRATSMELGCDHRGYSRAGHYTPTWYCVVLVGRPGTELFKMRETMSRTRDLLLIGGDLNGALNVDNSVSQSAVAALKENRLTFTWLDGEYHMKHCMFYVDADAPKICGPQSYEDDIDKSRIVIVRYSRKRTDVNPSNEKNKSTWDKLVERARENLQETEKNVASQLVANYNGHDNIQEIVQWISRIIEHGDTHDLPNHFPNTPELEADDVSSESTQGTVSNGRGIKQRIRRLAQAVNDLLADPRIGPSLILCACISFGTIWLQNRQRQHLTTENKVTRRHRANEKENKERTSNDDIPSSITDERPKDAYQLLDSDSD